ncbi:hypothetical protein V8C86DRAFT_1798849, partial [Haematococcus lacustris]
LQVFAAILTMRLLLYWFNVSWQHEPFKSLRSLTDPVLNPCLGILPSFRGVDFSPVLLLYGLGFVAKQLRIVAGGV